MRELPFAAALAALLACAPGARAEQHVTSGSGADYQPAVLKADDGTRIVVFERLNPSNAFGDLWITRSVDDGDTWSEPVAIMATGANERHPALVQTGPMQYVLFYLSDSTGSYRIFRATSTDGLAFTEEGPVDLGWPTGGEINPHVIRHADGTLTMSYQRPVTGASVYIAESGDDGVTWDTQETQIAAGAQLPRVAYRESDGLYLATYQTGGSQLKMWVKTTSDVHDWTAAPREFAATGDNHDSLPVVMPDGAFAVFWIRAFGNQYDIAVRRSEDGVTWSSPLAVTDTPDAFDVEPHPLVGESSSEVELYWGREAPVGSFDYDIVREPAVRVVDDVIFSGSFDG